MQNKRRMKAFVIDLLKENLPETYYYHNYEHTEYVAKKAMEIGRKENCTEEELDLIHTAALWHDTGYVNSYVNHEEHSCSLARKYLPEYNYSAEEIDEICLMIMATKIPQTPKNNLAEILADADLEYLGTSLFKEKGDLLFKEIQFINPSLTKEKWDDIQISFLRNHNYFTSFCKDNREPSKQYQLRKLEDGKKGL